MVSGDVSFHPECFRCLRCRRAIGFGDDYSFEERSELYCTECYETNINYFSKSKSFKLFQKSSIHQVNLNTQRSKSKFAFKVFTPSSTQGVSEDKTMKHPIRPSSVEQKNKRNSVVSIVSCDDETSDLQTGDTILEINGIPVTSDNINKLSKLLDVQDDDDKRISVTVERSPFTNDTPDDATHIDHLKPIPRTPSSADPALYQRNVTYFNFSLNHQRSNSDTTTEMRRKLAQRRKLPKKENSLDCLPEHERLKIIPNIEDRIDEKKSLVKSNSLSDLNSLEDDLDSREIFKFESSLHRAHSVKVDLAGEAASRVFRPVDLIFGEVIGKGFFGDVYKVKHRITGEEMVIKKLREIVPEAEEQFLKEVQLLKAMKHVNLLSFIGVMYKDRMLHIVVEYISGGTLRALLKHKFIEISWKQKLEISKDIASAMKYLHSKDVMHRDLKSKNVLIKTKDGRHQAIVADFGLATVMVESNLSKEKDEPIKTACISPRPIYKKRNTIVGSPYWMAPEMLNSEGYDETTDVFSYGIVLCEIISRLKADPDILPRTAKFGLDVANFSKKCSDCPKHVLNFAAACCSMEPEERPPFYAIEKWLQTFLANIEFNIKLPATMVFLNEPNPIRLLNSTNGTT